jgi:hypothetical protein
VPSDVTAIALTSCPDGIGVVGVNVNGTSPLAPAVTCTSPSGVRSSPRPSPGRASLVNSSTTKSVPGSP